MKPAATRTPGHRGGCVGARGHPDGNPQEINTDDDRLVERALRR